jgi:hypothetical protein
VTAAGINYTRPATKGTQRGYSESVQATELCFNDPMRVPSQTLVESSIRCAQPHPTCLPVAFLLGRGGLQRIRLRHCSLLLPLSLLPPLPRSSMTKIDLCPFRHRCQAVQARSVEPVLSSASSSAAVEEGLTCLRHSPIAGFMVEG